MPKSELSSEADLPRLSSAEIEYLVECSAVESDFDSFVSVCSLSVLLVSAAVILSSVLVFESVFAAAGLEASVVLLLSVVVTFEDGVVDAGLLFALEVDDVDAELAGGVVVVAVDAEVLGLVEVAEEEAVLDELLFVGLVAGLLVVVDGVVLPEDALVLELDGVDVVPPFDGGRVLVELIILSGTSFLTKEMYTRIFSPLGVMVTD